MLPQPRIVTCSDCHRDFETQATNVSYCPKCRTKHYRKTHPKQDYICQYPPCGKSFKSSMPWALYCCQSHRVLDFRRKLFEEGNNCQSVVSTNP